MATSTKIEDLPLNSKTTEKDYFVIQRGDMTYKVSADKVAEYIQSKVTKLKERTGLSSDTSTSLFNTWLVFQKAGGDISYRTYLENIAFVTKQSITGDITEQPALVDGMNLLTYTDDDKKFHQLSLSAMDTYVKNVKMKNAKLAQHLKSVTDKDGLRKKMGAMHRPMTDNTFFVRDLQRDGNYYYFQSPLTTDDKFLWFYLGPSHCSLYNFIGDKDHMGICSGGTRYNFFQGSADTRYPIYFWKISD